MLLELAWCWMGLRTVSGEKTRGLGGCLRGKLESDIEVPWMGGKGKADVALGEGAMGGTRWTKDEREQKDGASGSVEA